MLTVSPPNRDTVPESRPTQRGFSVLELLICVAIIAILMAMYSVTLSKALRKAKSVAGAEAMHQQDIDRMLGVDVSNPLDAYRRPLDLGNGREATITEMAYVVRNDAEFRAYWHTLIDPDQLDAPVFGDDGTLFAFDPEGNLFRLAKITSETPAGPSFPVAWDFISTVPSETALGDAGGNVLYSDGHIKYLQYPGPFPMSRTVATLSHEYMVAYE